MYREARGSVTRDVFSGYRSILQRLKITYGHDGVIEKLSRQGIPPPPSTKFAWQSTTHMTNWLGTLCHRSYQVYINTAHSKSATHNINNLPETDPTHRAILNRRSIDTMYADDFHRWQQSHLQQEGKRPAPSTRDLIGLGTILDVTIITINSTTKDQTTIYAANAPSATIYLNSFNGQHLDFQPHPANPDTITGTTAQGTVPPPATPERAPNPDPDSGTTEETEETEEDTSNEIRARNGGAESEEKVAAEAEEVDGNGEM